jgi:hypothetical protein
VAIFRDADGSEPVRIDPVEQLAKLREERRDARSWQLCRGTLACPECDAPVAPLGALGPADGLDCPVCGHGAAVRDFLTLGEPTRPAHVVVRLVRPAVTARP